jgi:hypothetical protein
MKYARQRCQVLATARTRHAGRAAGPVILGYHTIFCLLRMTQDMTVAAEGNLLCFWDLLIRW